MGQNILWMEEILHHLGWLKPYKYWDVYHLSTGDLDFATIQPYVHILRDQHP